jgi:hypothetical protein
MNPVLRQDFFCFRILTRFNLSAKMQLMLIIILF